MNKEIATFGHIRPNAELRKAIDKLEALEEAYNRYNFIDFLKSVNEHYLNGEGEVNGPHSFVDTDVKQDDNITKDDGLNLEDACPSVKATLSWQDGESEKEIMLELQVTRSDTDRFDQYRIVLWANSTSKEFDDQNMRLSTNLQRDFYASFEEENPIELSEGIDDALITFSEELLESRIIKY